MLTFPAPLLDELGEGHSLVAFLAFEQPFRLPHVGLDAFACTVEPCRRIVAAFLREGESGGLPCRKSGPFAVCFHWRRIAGLDVFRALFARFDHDFAEFAYHLRLSFVSGWQVVLPPELPPPFCHISLFFDSDSHGFLFEGTTWMV